jgi:hypothetical protein
MLTDRHDPVSGRQAIVTFSLCGRAGAGSYAGGMFDHETRWFLFKMKVYLFAAVMFGALVYFVVRIYGWAFLQLFAE